MAAECHSRSGFVFQRKLSVDFRGGEITGEAGLVLVREFDERLGLTQRLRKLVRDDRDRRYITHNVLGLLRQRIYQIVAGYEDATDATSLRNDPTMRAVVQRVESPLASQPTLSRLENNVDWESIRLLENEGMQWFCAVGHRRRRPEEIILDVDSTEDPTHGQQALSFYNGHYDSYMYHPLLVFEGNRGVLLASCLRPGNVGGISHLLPLLRPLIARLRARFSKSTIAIRADGDFAKPKLLDFAEYGGCLYAIGMARNCVLEARVESWRKKAERRWEQTGGKPLRLYTSFFYKAQSWSRARRIVVEYTSLGYNPRFLVTNRSERAEEVFAWYSLRGQAENFIKDLKNEIAADRLSCSAYRANAFRLQLHALAYNLLVLFRRLVLRGTALATATIATLRLDLFKVAARVRRSARRLWFHVATGWPGQSLFLQVFDRIAVIRGPS